MRYVNIHISFHQNFTLTIIDQSNTGKSNKNDHLVEPTPPEPDNKPSSTPASYPQNCQDPLDPNSRFVFFICLALPMHRAHASAHFVVMPMDQDNGEMARGQIVWILCETRSVTPRKTCHGRDGLVSCLCTLG